MNYDHEAIRKAHPDTDLEIIDGKGIFLINTECSQTFTPDDSLVAAARVELDKLNYQNDRVTGIGSTSGYVHVKEQLDQLYHDINAGKFGADAKTGNWFVGITSVKTNIPKPS